MTFSEEVAGRIEANARDHALNDATQAFIESSLRAKYSYNFSWLGRPVIQYPQDMVAVQELIWSVRPDLIIETGIAHGGSLILSASLLAMLELCDATEAGTTLDPSKPTRKVLGIDIDIREHNRTAIEAHPLANRIEMIQGSSIAPEVVERVRGVAAGHQTVMVFLDSNHTHEHVLEELKAYAPLTSVGSYCVAFDTVVEDVPAELSGDRPWAPGNNPKTAVASYLESDSRFELDRAVENKLQITVAPGGYLRRLR